MRTYLTFCDYYYSNFLFINLSSLSHNLSDRCLFIIYSLDKNLPNIINKWRFKNIQIVIRMIENIKDERIAKMKSNRSYKYFCWGLSPFVIKDCLIKEKKTITYLDTDVVFNIDPNFYFNKRNNELKDKILLTPHFYENQSLPSVKHGKYCIQFMSFPFKENILSIVDKWAKDCFSNSGIDLDNNVFGDQLYLDKWETKYKESIYIESNKSHFIGPWNTNSFSSKSTILVHLHSSKFFRFYKLFIFIACATGFKLSKKHKNFIKYKLLNHISAPKIVNLLSFSFRDIIRSLLVSIYLNNPIVFKFIKK